MVIKMRNIASLPLFCFLLSTSGYSQTFNEIQTVPFYDLDIDEIMIHDFSVGLTSANNKSILPATIQSFYEADWKMTRIHIEKLKLVDASDPFPHFLSAMIPFWTYFFGGNEPEVARQFLDLSFEAIKMGEKRLEDIPTDTSAILLLSGLHGYRSLVAAREKHYRIAMSSGITGYSFTKTLLKMDDGDPNTLMGQGVFHYMVGSIPGEVRWMARLAGLSGSKEHGLEMLEKAALADSHVSNDARMFLSHLYEQEGRFVEAHRHLIILSEKYPSNIIFLYNLGRMYEAKNQVREAESAYKKVLSTPTNELSILHDMASNRLKLLEPIPVNNASY
jgi:tetratricopeptide (TPR) repeat protein